MRTKFLAVLLLAAPAGFCQTPVKDAETLQSLLTEVHQLRQAIEGMTAASQRVQIALSGMQMQDVVVARSAAQLDETQKRCRAVDADRQRLAAVIQKLDAALLSGALPEHETKDVRSILPDRKAELEARTAELQTCQSDEAQAAGHVRNEQARLAELRDRIDRLDKALETLSSPAK